MMALVRMKGLENQSSAGRGPASPPESPRNSATSTKPITSTFNPRASSALRSSISAFGSSTNMLTRNSDSAPTGTLIRKHQCQEALSVIKPPNTGPTTGPTITTTP